MNHNYAGARENLSDPYAFPGGGDPRGLPPILLVDADRDSLRASGGARPGDRERTSPRL